MTTLDDLKQIKKLDKASMVSFISDLPDQILKAYQGAQKIKMPENYKNIKNIVICGMGGSAIGGDLIKIMTENQLTIPLIVNRSWELPSIVNKDSLVFLVSFSGQTKEILNCAKTAIKKRAKISIITGGGELQKIAQKYKLPIFKFQYSGPPRAGLGYLSIPILVILEKLNLINLNNWQISSSVTKLENFNQIFYPKATSEKNIAKYLAYFIFDHLPIIIAPENLGGLARRFKTQMAENSKNFCFFETFPEIFHNSIESQFPWRLKDEIVFLIFENFNEKSNTNQALRSFQKLLDQEKIDWEGIPSFGDNLFIQIFSLVLLGDWISFYLSILNKIDPTPVTKIQWLKKQMNPKGKRAFSRTKK